MQCRFCNNQTSAGCYYCNPLGITVPNLNEFPTVPQKGWECPKCKAVMSPSMSVCVNCTGNKGN